VTDEKNGAITSFTGTVRSSTNDKSVVSLDFEAYIPMALKEMEKIAHEAKSKWDINEVAIHHRIGQLNVGEIAVIIAVSAPHRLNTFAACQYCIDTLKETVPIWKKEHFTDGEVWVSAHP
jgi:molybdopterin synthase catalytic subunit